MSNDDLDKFISLPRGMVFSTRRLLDSSVGTTLCLQQQVLQTGFPDSELDKCKVVSDDLEVVEVRLRNTQCDRLEQECKTLEIENEQLKNLFQIDNDKAKIHNDEAKIDNVKAKIDNDKTKLDDKFEAVNSFATTMQMLNPSWKEDKRLILQTQDVLKNGFFNGSSALQLENGCSLLDSIFISQVALDMGSSLMQNQTISSGARAAKI